MYKIILLSVMLTVLCGHAIARGPLHIPTRGQEVYLHKDGMRYSLDTPVAYHIDVTKRLTIEELLTRPSNYPFRAVPSSYFNVGDGTGRYIWMRIDLRGGVPLDDIITDLVIEIESPLVTEVHFYAAHGASLVHSLYSGRHLLPDRRPIPGHTHAFPARLDDEGRGLFYLQLSYDTSVTIPLWIWERDTFLIRGAQRDVLAGLYYGLAVLTVLLFIVLGLAMRTLSYVWYSLFALSMSCFTAGLFGHISYFFPRFYIVFYEGTLFFFALSPLFAILFTVRFLGLHLERANPLTVICYTLAGVQTCLLLSIPLAPLRTAAILAQFGGLMAGSAVMVAAIVRVAQGFKPPRLFLLAWGSQLVLMPIFVMGTSGMIVSNFFVHHSLLIGQLIMVLMMNLAIGSQFNRAQRTILSAAHRFLPNEFIALLRKQDIRRISLGDRIEMRMTIVSRMLCQYC